MNGSGRLAAAASEHETVPADFEIVPCPLCGASAFHTWLQAPDRFAVDRGEVYRIVRCRACGFHYLNPRPRPEALPRYYASEGYQPFLSTRDRVGLWERLYALVRRFSVRHKRRRIERFQRAGSVLDVGCGTGEFLDEMQRHGWRVLGLEVDEAAADFARRRYGLEVRTQALEDLAEEGAQFDVITFWHVLEHLYDPKRSLQAAHALLQEGGVLLLAAPNLASTDARFYRANWVALDAPRHLHHFTPDSVRKVGRDTGWDLVHSQPMWLDTLFNCLMSERLSADRRHASALTRAGYLVRGGAVALVSLFRSSRLRREGAEVGSAVLYFLKKATSPRDRAVEKTTHVTNEERAPK